jgi:hypothetical protein
MIKCLVQIVAALAVFCGGTASAETPLAKLQADLVSSWLVIVEGERRTRTLRIRGVEQKDTETFPLDAAYGWTDENQTMVKAEIRQAAQERTLFLTTQPGSKIAASQKTDGTFSGTFTNPSGQTKGVRIEKASEDELRKVASAFNSPLVIEKAAADVPALCASFLGAWKGIWGNGYGEEWLWVIGVDANCNAKYSYGRQPKNFSVAKIEKGVLSTPCAKAGTCSFDRHGDDLWGRWYGPGGSNNITLQKIQ